MSPAQLIISAIYYIIVVILSFFSIFGVYILVRYGRSLIFSLVVSALYAFFFLSLLAQSYSTFKGLLQ